MSPRTAHLLRAATVAGFLLFCVLLYRALTDRGDDVQLAEPRRGEVTVEDAIHLAGSQPLTVRGYPFMAGADLRLCHGTLEGRPRRCVGPYLILERLDSSRLDLGGSDAVAVSGRISGTIMQVDQLFN
jgi:hypothetical protein